MFCRLSLFRDRGLDNQQTRATALDLVTAAMILFNCRYLGRAFDELRRRAIRPTSGQISGLSSLGWDRTNLSGDHVWSDGLQLDSDGLMPLISSHGLA